MTVTEAPPQHRRYAPKTAPEGFLENRQWGYRSRHHLAVHHAFGVRSEDGSIGAFLDDVFAAFVIPGQPRSWYSIVDRGPTRTGRYALYHEAQRIALRRSLGEVASYLQWHVNREVTRRAQGSHLVLHAAAASYGRHTVVLPAPMEHGKTTTVAGLCQAGFAYLTDEAVCIDRQTLRVAPYPKALSVDHGSWTVLPDLEPWHAGIVPGQWQVPPRVFGGNGMAAGAPTVVVTPRYVQGSTTALTPISRGTMLMRLVECTFDFTSQPRGNLDVLAALVQRAACYDLTIGDLHEAVRLMAAAVGAEGST